MDQKHPIRTIKVRVLRTVKTTRALSAPPVAKTVADLEPAPALTKTSDAREVFTYQHPEGIFVYHYTKRVGDRPGKLKVRIAASRMAEFRESRAGLTFSSVVDIFQQTGGWYEITSTDLSNHEVVVGSKVDGLAAWLPAFVGYFNNHVEVVSPRMTSQPAPPQPERTVVRGDNGRLVLRRPVASEDRIRQLADAVNTRFGHK